MALVEKLNFLARFLHLFERVLAVEELRDQNLEAVLYLLLLGLGDITAHLRPGNQQNESHFEHLFVAEQEPHLWKPVWVTHQCIRVSEVDWRVVH